MIPHHIVVIDEVCHHLLVAALAVAQAEAAFDFNRVPGPVQTGGFAHQRPPAAVEHTAHDAPLRVVVGGLGVFVHIETGKATTAHPVFLVVGVRQPL